MNNFVSYLKKETQRMTMLIGASTVAYCIAKYACGVLVISVDTYWAVCVMFGIALALPLLAYLRMGE